MKKFEFDELIEKAFSIGYEYALMEQREFGAVKRENKKKKREWEKSLGRDAKVDNNSGLNYLNGYIAGKRAADKTKKGESWRLDFDGDDVSAGRLLRKNENDNYISQSLNDRINRKGEAEKIYFQKMKKNRYLQEIIETRETIILQVELIKLI